MLAIIKKEWLLRVPLFFFIFYTGWWIILQTLNLTVDSPIRDYFASTYTIMALWGGLWGLQIAYQWGGMKSVFGKAIAFFSLGLLAQTFGQLTYTFYVMIMKIEIPYPSLGDVGYFGSIIFYILGVLFIAKTSGITFSLKIIESKIQAVILPAIILGCSYFIFVKGHMIELSQPIKTLLDFGYPLGQAVYISLALLTLLLTKQYLGGLMKPKIVTLLAALVAQYAADFNFLFQTSRQTWTYAGYGDYLYFLAYFLMTLALLQLKTAFEEVKQI